MPTMYQALGWALRIQWEPDRLVQSLWSFHSYRGNRQPMRNELINKKVSESGNALKESEQVSRKWIEQERQGRPL